MHAHEAQNKTGKLTRNHVLNGIQSFREVDFLFVNPMLTLVVEPSVMVDFISVLV